MAIHRLPVNRWSTPLPGAQGWYLVDTIPTGRRAYLHRPTSGVLWVNEWHFWKYGPALEPTFVHRTRGEHVRYRLNDPRLIEFLGQFKHSMGFLSASSDPPITIPQVHLLELHPEVLQWFRMAYTLKKGVADIFAGSRFDRAINRIFHPDRFDPNDIPTGDEGRLVADIPVWLENGYEFEMIARSMPANGAGQAGHGHLPRSSGADSQEDYLGMLLDAPTNGNPFAGAGEGRPAQSATNANTTAQGGDLFGQGNTGP